MTRRVSITSVIFMSQLLFLTGCVGKDPLHEANVIVVLIDTLRRDHVGAGGSQKGLSPFMDRLASEGFCFRQALAACSWTKPSVASLLTGLYPVRHGAVGCRKFMTDFSALNPDHTTLAERLKSAGYETAAFVTNPHIIPQYYFDQGFDEFTQPAGDAEALFMKALAWLGDTERKEKFFLYLHVLDPHMPYFPPEEYRKKYVKGDPGPGTPFTRLGSPMEIQTWAKQYSWWRPDSRDEVFQFDYNKIIPLLKDRFPEMAPKLTPQEFRSHIFLDFKGKDDPALLRRKTHLVSLYDGEVAYTDDVLHRFVQSLKTHGLWEDTVFVVTADHGEAFLEHGKWGHGTGLYAEELNIPMIIHLPGKGTPYQGTYDGPVSHVDLYPTLLDILGLPVPTDLDGLSLWPVIRDPDRAVLPERPVFSETVLQDGGKMVAAVGYDKKAIWMGTSDGRTRWLFFDMKSDPHDRKPLSSKRGGGAVKELKGAIEGLLKNSTRASSKEDKGEPLSKDLIEQMKALGYF